MTSGSGTQVVQTGTVLITATDDTAAGVKAAQTTVARGMAAIDSSAKGTEKGFGAVGAAAGRAGAAIGSAMGLAAAGAGALLGTVGAAAAAVDKLTADSLKAQRVSAGLQFNIEGAARAFGGYVDNVSLAQSANKAYAMGVVQTGAEFERLAKGVNAIALQFGEDATMLLDNAVTAVGRQSRLILDNLGIILDNARAEKLYAESLGKTTAQLTAYEKEVSFSKAAMLLIAKAGDEAAVSIDGFAAKAQKAKVALENYRQGVLGFNTQIGKTREVMRALSDKELEQLKFGYAAAIDGSTRAGRAFDEMLGNAGALDEYAATLGKSVDDLTAAEIEQAKALKDTGVGLMEVKKLAQELGVSYDDLIAMEERRRKIEGDKQAKKEQDAQTRANIKGLRDQAAELEHEVEMREVLGMTERDNLEITLQALAARKLAADTEYQLTGEIEAQNEALRVQRQIELLQLKSETGQLAKRRGGSGPSEADRIRAEGQAAVDALAHQVELAEVLGQLRGTEAADAHAIGLMRLDAARAELDLEERALAVTRAKNSVERARVDARLVAIGHEREMLDLQRRAEERAAANDLVERAVEEQQRATALRIEQARQEAREVANVIDLEQARLSREEQAIRSRGSARQAAARHELESMVAIEQTEAEQHAVRMRQLAAEAAARQRALDAREAEVSATSPTNAIEREQQIGELRQIEHERQLARMDAELAVARAKDAEESRLAAAQHARLQATIGTVEESIGALSQLYGQASDFAGAISSQRAAQSDADLARTTAALEARGRAQQRSLDAEIKAAEGNASRQAELRRQGVRMQAELQARVEKAQADHAERQRRTESRAAGTKLLIDGAVNAAKAVSAYASYNFVQGALYTAAAAFNFAQGGMLLAGNVPGAGGGSGSSSLGSSGGGSGFADRETSAAARTPGSVPGEAARRSVGGAVSQQQQGGSVVNVERIEVMGGLDDETAEKIARALDKVSQTREGAAA